MVPSRRADLHTHSVASDGTQTPSDNVRQARELDLAAIALTDHDTTAGLEEALAEGDRLQMEVVPGVEISTVADNQDIHVLGYYVGYRNPLFQTRLKSLRDTRERRNDMIIDKLRELGMDVSMEEVIDRLDRTLDIGETIGRPHIATLLLGKGYVASIKEAFDRYLGSHGAAYVNLPRITPQQAITWIREAGGCAVLAHPGLYGNDDLVSHLIASGLDGIEAYHSDHTLEQEKRYVDLAVRHRIIVTGGSDFHGERGGAEYHGPIGNRTVDYSSVHMLKQLSARERNFEK
jgi:predicted metal-dependent phosphoesterase TrpH